jgi:hypothetical protein
MDSVDRALLYLADKYGFRDRIRFYRLYAPQPTAPEDENADITYSIIPPDDDFFRSQSATLYWGDFLHMRQYQETVARRLMQFGLAGTLEAARKRVREVFLQMGQSPDTVGKALTFGSTLIFNTISDEMDADYYAALTRFLRSCRAAWFRDVFSAFKACLIRGSLATSCLGLDCANLIDPDRVYPLDGRPPIEDRVGVFMGRTAGNTEAIVQFTIDLARDLHCTPTWLSWGDAEAFPALPLIMKTEVVRSLDRFTERPAQARDDASASLLTYRAIVTDTYHVLVNAWNFGVPAICVINNEYSESRNVNFGDSFARRDKREVFMSTYSALDFLVRDDELRHAEQRSARIRHLIRLIDGRVEIGEIQARIRTHARLAEQQLMQVLSDLL